MIEWATWKPFASCSALKLKVISRGESIISAPQRPLTPPPAIFKTISIMKAAACALYPGPAPTLWGCYSVTLTWPVHGQPCCLDSSGQAATGFLQLRSSCNALGARCFWGTWRGVLCSPSLTSAGMANITKGVRSPQHGHLSLCGQTGHHKSVWNYFT